MNHVLSQGDWMKSITIHGLDSRLVEGIERRAQQRGASLNKTIKELIAQSLGLRFEGGGMTDSSLKGYRQFLGQWSEEEELAFKRATVDFKDGDGSELPR
jgi:hypothetical protein